MWDEEWGWLFWTNSVQEEEKQEIRSFSSLSPHASLSLPLSLVVWSDSSLMMSFLFPSYTYASYPPTPVVSELTLLRIELLQKRKLKEEKDRSSGTQ